MTTTSTQTVVVVTGSNTGIGYVTIRALITSGHPYTAILCSRDLKKGQDAASKLQGEAKNGSEVIPLQLDITDDTSIERFVKDVTAKFGRVDILINNAGVSLDGYMAQGKMTAREAWNDAYDTNVTSTHIFTTALMPLLFTAAPSPDQTRILFVSSEVGSHAWHKSNPEIPINAPVSAGWPKEPGFSITAYRSSKTGMGMMHREWCRVLANDHIKVHLVCPGMVATSFGGVDPAHAKEMGAQDPALSGAFFRDVVEGKYEEYAGLGGKLISQDVKGHAVDW